MAEEVWRIDILIIIILIIFSGIIDISYSLKNQPTISLFLRQNPEWFWVPASGLILFLVGLAFHLYFAPWS